MQCPIIGWRNSIQRSSIEMNSTSQDILAQLQAVDLIRAQRQADPLLAAKVLAVKAYQARRFELTYADLSAEARYSAVTRFFMAELYGPQEFSQRDAQFARVVPALVRLFPKELAQTVHALCTLHALSEGLDSDLARHLPGTEVVPERYVLAWQGCARRADRARQVELTFDIGSALDQHTRSSVLRVALASMRKPAEAAGLANLQRFLEAGVAAFRSMNGAAFFLATVQAREQRLMQALFSAPTGPDDLPFQPGDPIRALLPN